MVHSQQPRRNGNGNGNRCGFSLVAVAFAIAIIGTSLLAVVCLLPVFMKVEQGRLLTNPAVETRINPPN